MQGFTACEGQVYRTVLPDAPWFMLALVVENKALVASEWLDACCTSV